jgi:indolepyruvate ferredoxin oxidoreductase, beta subunit
VITSTRPFVNIPEYPDIEKVKEEIRKLPHYIALDADEVAKQVATAKAANIVILGAASPFLEMNYEQLEDAIRFTFRKKGDEVITKNLDALKAGRKFAEDHMNL